MNYIGIDIHKKHCVLSALNEAGERPREARIGTNDRAGFEDYLRAVGGPCRAVIEACWGWGKVHDLLEATGLVEEVVLAHPFKTRIIAEAQIKTDSRAERDSLRSSPKGEHGGARQRGRAFARISAAARSGAACACAGAGDAAAQGGAEAAAVLGARTHEDPQPHARAAGSAEHGNEVSRSLLILTISGNWRCRCAVTFLAGRA